MRIAVCSLALLLACGSKSAEGPKPEERIKTLEGELQKTKDELLKANAATEDLRKNEAELKAKADEASQLQAKLSAAVGKSFFFYRADGPGNLHSFPTRRSS